MKLNTRLLKTTLAAVAVTAIHAQAQQLHHELPGSPPAAFRARLKHVPVLNTLATSTAQKGTAIEQRVIAESAHFRTVSGGSQPYDSTRFKYSGTRGSKFASNGSLSYIHYAFDSHAAGDLNEEFGVKADSVWLYANANSSGILGLSGYKSIGYAAGDRISNYEEKRYLSMPMEVGQRSLYVYNAGGKLIGHRTAAWEPASSNWRPNDSSSKRYSATGQLIADTSYIYSSFSGSWSPRYVISYDYNAAGYVTRESYYNLPGTGREFTRINYVYDAANRYATIDYAMDVNGSLINDSRMTYTYMGTSVNYSSVVSDDWDTLANVWVPQFRDERLFNSQGMVDTAIQSQWNKTTNVWEQQSWVNVQYNSRNNPVAMWHYADMQVPYHTVVRYFYYEDYNTIPNTVANTHIIPATIYPNPVTDKLNISLKEVEGKIITIHINDVMGRLVSSEQFTWHQAVTQFSVGHLSPGTYSVNIETADGRAQQMIIKQ